MATSSGRRVVALTRRGPCPVQQPGDADQVSNGLGWERAGGHRPIPTPCGAGVNVDLVTPPAAGGMAHRRRRGNRSTSAESLRQRTKPEAKPITAVADESYRAAMRAPPVGRSERVTLRPSRPAAPP